MAQHLQVDESVVTSLELGAIGDESINLHGGRLSPMATSLMDPPKIEVTLEALPNATDSAFWGGVVRALAVWLGCSAADIVDPESGQSVGAALKEHRGDKSINDLLASAPEGFSRALLARCENNLQEFVEFSALMVRWAEACDVPVACLVF
jgi:hypothetical protein